MSDCLFCKIVSGEIATDTLYKDDQVTVFRDIHPKADVHVLMVPNVHIESLNALTTEHDGLVAHMLRLLPILAKEQGLENGFRTIINTGPGGGQEIFHLHLHLLGGKNLSGF